MGNPVQQANVNLLAPDIFADQAFSQVAPFTLGNACFPDQVSKRRAENVGIEGRDGNRTWLRISLPGHVIAMTLAKALEQFARGLDCASGVVHITAK
ncbi:hypothetical protein A4R29_15515 [Mesorhizobium ciceri biovar biserrulae]|nr:hypothetical protein A4R29_15515 [Mesorhizobium ciceri biovar biserrulae]